MVLHKISITNECVFKDCQKKDIHSSMFFNNQLRRFQSSAKTLAMQLKTERIETTGQQARSSASEDETLNYATTQVLRSERNEKPFLFQRSADSKYEKAPRDRAGISGN